MYGDPYSIKYTPAYDNYAKATNKEKGKKSPIYDQDHKSCHEWSFWTIIVFLFMVFIICPIRVCTKDNKGSQITITHDATKRHTEAVLRRQIPHVSHPVITPSLSAYFLKQPKMAPLQLTAIHRIPA